MGHEARNADNGQTGRLFLPPVGTTTLARPISAFPVLPAVTPEKPERGDINYVKLGRLIILMALCAFWTIVLMVIF